MTRRAEDISRYDYMRSGDVPLTDIMEAAQIASAGEEKDLNKYIKYLKNKDSAIRYWGATGLLILGEKAAPAKNDLINVLNDESPNVIVVASETLYKLGEKEQAINALLKVLEYPEDKARCHALNALVYVEDDSRAVKNAIARLLPEKQYKYSWRIVNWLAEEWKIKPE